MKIKDISLAICFLFVFSFSKTKAQEFKLVKTLYNQNSSSKICISPDGRLFASVNSDETLTIYSIPDFKIFKTLSGPYVYHMSFSPYSSYFSCVNNKDNQVRIYSLPTFQLIKTFAGSDLSVGTKLIAFNKNEKFFEITTGEIIELYTLPEFELIKTFVDVDDVLGGDRRRCYSQDGKYFAAINSNFVVAVYSIHDYRLMEGLKFPSEAVRSVSFSPDGTFLAVETEDLNPNESALFKPQKVRFYLMPEIKLVRTLLDKSGVVSSTFSPNGKFFVCVAHSENIIKIHSLPEFKLVKALTGHSDFVRAIAFSNDGKYFASGGQDNKTNVYRITHTIR